MIAMIKLQNSFSLLLVFSIALASISSGGCNRQKIKGLVPVQGVLLYEEKPLAWATISFLPKKPGGEARQAVAQTDAEGRFVLKTLGEDGVLPGEYDICVSKWLRDNGKETVAAWKKNRMDASFKEQEPEEGTFKVVLAIPENFTTTKNSGLSVTIDPRGDREIELRFGNDVTSR